MADFPKYKAGDAVSASHLNALSEIARRYMAEVPDRGYGGGTFFRTMIITDVILEPSDEADDDDDSSYSSSSSDSRSSVSHSTSSSSKSSSSGVRTIWNDVRSYMAQPLYYDFGAKAWLVDPTHNPYELDASAFHGLFEVGDTCIAFWDAARSAYIAMPMMAGGGGSGTSDGGTTSIVTGTCCCDELDCLENPAGYTGTIPIFAYTLSLSGFACGCTDPDDPTAEHPEASPSLEQVDPEDDTIWQSKTLVCVAAAGTQIAVTVISSWTWNGTSWDFVSDDVTATGTPTQPEYDGTSPGQTATTTRSGYKTADGTSDTVDGFWRLTIGTLDDMGCDSTKLEFHLG